MKSKILPLALLFVFLLVLLVVGRPLIFPDREATGLDPEREKGLTVIFKPEKKEWSEAGLEEVEKFISKKQKEFSSLPTEILNKKDYEAIGNAYEDGGFLSTHEGKSVKGKQDIIKYFKDHSRNITNLEFKLEFVYAEELTHILNLPGKKPDDIVHIAYLIMSVSFHFDGEPIDPPSGSNWRHIRMCDWEPDI